MNSNNKDTIHQITESNPEVKSAISSIIEENRLILSRFTHELRNPLTLVKSTLQLIETKHPEVKSFKYWNNLQTDLDDTVSILNELSAYNHCDEIRATNVNLLTLIQASVEGIQPLALDKNVLVTFSHDQQEDIYSNYCCDCVKMKETLTNLLKNAVEAATNDTTIYVDISCAPDAKTNGHYINISITNSGTPIKPENLTSIFEPFVSTKSNGTGLGLAISKRIAQLHHGNLSVSQTDNTVTFTLSLPVDVKEAVVMKIAQ